MDEYDEMLEDFILRGYIEMYGVDGEGEPLYRLGPNADEDPEFVKAWIEMGSVEIENRLWDLSNKGLVEVFVDRDGEIAYSITDEGRAAVEEMLGQPLDIGPTDLLQ